MTDAYITLPFNMEKLSTEQRVVVSSQPPAVRQHMIETLLYPSPLFKKGNAFIGKFHHPVTGGRHGTGKIGGLLGPSRVGKSAICKFYRSHHPARIEEDGEAYPVVYFQASDDMTPRTMAERICEATGARSLAQMKTPALIDTCINRLVRAKTELLIIDDAQFMFMGRRVDQVRNFKSFIKLASDRNAFNTLLVGEPIIKDVVTAVDYLVGRGGFPNEALVPLGDTTDEFEQFTLMLEGIDNRLPFLMKSNLSDAKIAADIHRFSGGLIGRVMNLVQASAFEAINAGTSKIMIEHLRSAATMLVAANDSHSYFR
ncbi:AAA family ATPase [Rhizobium sp. Rhizsp42]|uniref:AAA family ATPase n=1 Tax=Rhizobium sp. Rhizsp42 TaxID=3243034 RepID=UPI0039AFFD1B